MQRSKRRSLGKKTMTYDRLGRMTAKALPDLEGTVTYAYDSLSGSENALGRLVAIDDPAQRKELSYDRLGRVKREVRRFKDLGSGLAEFDKDYETNIEHDLLGRKMQVTYPADPKSGKRVVATNHYCAMGIVSVSVYYDGVSKGIVSTVDYDEFGARTRLVRGNGTATNYQYDARRRLTDILSASPMNGTTATVQDLHYTFNIQNSITAVKGDAQVGPEGAGESAVTYNYRYDGQNRLIHATGRYERGGLELLKQFEHAYSYVQNGNLTRKDFLDPDSHSLNDRWSYTYTNHAATRVDAALHAGRFIMEYDSNGNMTRHADNAESRSKTMTYDSNNRIRTVKDESTNETVGKYYYDDGGFRVRRISKRQVEGQYYEHEILYTSMYMGLEIQKDQRGNTVTNSYAAVNNVYLNGLRVATMIPSGEITYFLTDQVDSVRTVLNEAGQPVSRTEFLPYGETWFQEGNESFAPKFNSQELDKESGLYFYNARYYDAKLGRFVTADNVIDGEYETQGWNRYSYVKGNPVGFSDPSGNNAVILDAPEGAGGFGHSAVITEDKDTGKWHYYSRQQKNKSDGTYRGSPNVRGRVFSNPDEFFSYQSKMTKERTFLENKREAGKISSKDYNDVLKNNPDLLEFSYANNGKVVERYEKGLEIKLTRKQDKLLMNYLDKNIDKQYNFVFQNCRDLVSRGLDHAGYKNYNSPNISPNLWYQFIEKTAGKTKERDYKALDYRDDTFPERVR